MREYRIIQPEHWDFLIIISVRCLPVSAGCILTCSLYIEFERIIKTAVCRKLLLIGKSLCMHIQLVP